MDHRGSVVFIFGLAVAMAVPAFPQPGSEGLNCDCTCVAGSVSEKQQLTAPAGRSCIVLNSTATNKKTCQVRGREGTLERCVQHVNPPPTPYNGPLSNWDLVSPVSDDNGLLKNPLWLFQTPASPGPPKDLAGCLKNRRFDPSCSSQNVTIDAASGTNEVPCGSDFRGIHPGSPVGIDGHVDWVNATYEGLISWDENSVDHDFNFNLDPPPGTKFPIGAFYFFDGVQWNFQYVDLPIHIEFMSDETVDNFADPWWKSLHDNHPAKDAALGFAVVTGLIGLDCEHDCHIEVHPAYAMAIRVKDDPSDETWAIFVRDFGTEGFCSSDPHLLPHGDSIRLRLPWNPAANGPAARVTVKSSSFWDHEQPTAGPVVQPFPPGPPVGRTQPEGSLLVSFRVPAITPPVIPTWAFNGELHLQYSGPISTSPAQPSTPRPRATFTRNRVPVADAEESIGKLIAQMSPAQRQVYQTKLKSTVATPTVPPRSGTATTPGTEARVGPGPEPKKLAADLARRDALCAAYSNNVPGFPGWCEASGPVRPMRPAALPSPSPSRR